jgi:hypothetical protein
MLYVAAPAAQRRLTTGARDEPSGFKKGDQVEVTYTEALALSVEPTPKPAAK